MPLTVGNMGRLRGECEECHRVKYIRLSLDAERLLCKRCRRKGIREQREERIELVRTIPNIKQRLENSCKELYL